MTAVTNTNPILVREKLDSHLLHVRPINTHLMTFVGQGSITIDKYLISKHWNSRLVRVLSVSLYASGAVLSVPIALVESITSLALLTLCALANTVTSGRFFQLKKLNTKCFAFALETVVQPGIGVWRLKNGSLPKYYTEVMLQDHGVHGAASGFSYLGKLAIESTKFTSDAQQKQYMVERIGLFIPLVIEGIKQIIPDATRAIIRDIQGNAGIYDRIRTTSNQIGLSRPNQELLIREIRALDSRRLVRDATYRNTTFRNITPVIREALQLIGGRRVGQATVVGVQAGDEEKYQDHLQACTKEAIKRVYHDDHLALCLDMTGKNSPQEGKDAIEIFDASAVLPIASMAQLVEIEKFSNPNGIKCPTKFSSKLQQYNPRHAKISDLSKKLEILTPGEKDLLMQRLLKGSDFVPSSIVHKAEFDVLVKGIGELGGDIHQGSLMGVLRLQMSANPVQGMNMFSKAWQDAVKELVSAPQSVNR